MSWFKENNFLFRKIHSLLGIFPVGIFLIEHLVTNSFAKFGPEVYNEKIEWIQGLPYLLAMEATLIWVPLLLHAGLGFVYLWAWKDNSARYRYPRNFMYTLQRITGMVAFAFIATHVWDFRIETALKGIPIDFDLVAAELTSPFMFIFYVMGVASTVFHFSNGIWGFLIHWGITIGPKAQRWSGMVCAGIGALLLYIGMDSLFAFVR